MTKKKLLKESSARGSYYFSEFATIVKKRLKQDERWWRTGQAKVHRLFSATETLLFSFTVREQYAGQFTRRLCF
jgi:hypothetical protein